MGKGGGNGLASESRAGRCLANSMHATGVEASAPASVRPPPRGFFGLRMQPGSPGAGLPYLSTCGLVLYGQGGARESRAWSHVCQADPSARNLTGLLSESRYCGRAAAGLPADDSDEVRRESRHRGNHTNA